MFAESPDQIRICSLFGPPKPSSHDRTTVCAIPILNATRPNVRFFSIRFALIQSPIVLILVGNGLARFSREFFVRIECESAVVQYPTGLLTAVRGKRSRKGGTAQFGVDLDRPNGFTLGS